ncbi:hypothetical protein ACU4GD_16630 [Cupriavidus basilensis]
MALAIVLLQVPLKGSFLALSLGAALFVLAATALGLLVSTFVRSQVAAIFGTAILCLIPSVNFSGLLYPVSTLTGSELLDRPGLSVVVVPAGQPGQLHQGPGRRQLWRHVPGLAGFRAAVPGRRAPAPAQAGSVAGRCRDEPMGQKRGPAVRQGTAQPVQRYHADGADRVRLYPGRALGGQGHQGRGVERVGGDCGQRPLRAVAPPARRDPSAVFQDAGRCRLGTTSTRRWTVAAISSPSRSRRASKPMCWPAGRRRCRCWSMPRR